jgi:hypothetical protein
MAASVLTDFTSYDVIRAILGVSEPEVEDNVLAQDNYLQEVLFRLEELNDTIVTQFDTITAINEADRTLRQKQYLKLVGMVSAYIVADKIVKGSIALFAPKRITDGKGQQERVDDPFSTLRDDIAAGLVSWTSRLASVLNILDSTQTIAAAPTRTYIGGVGLGVDPVTGA